MNAFIFLFIYFYGTRISFISLSYGVSSFLFHIRYSAFVCYFHSLICSHSLLDIQSRLVLLLCQAFINSRCTQNCSIYNTLRDTISLHVQFYASVTAPAGVVIVAIAIVSSHYSFPCYFYLTV